MEGNGQDPALFDQINNALIGDMPSFGAGKESKFQQLMRNHSINNSNPAFGGQQQSQDAGPDISKYASFDHPSEIDTGLCADAKEFKPAVPQSSHSSYSSTMSSFESLNLSGHNGMNPGVSASLRPNPAAREFVPRNQSAPNLQLSQMQAPVQPSSSMVAPAIPGIKEFIPSSRLAQIGSQSNGVIQQQPTSYMSSHSQRFLTQGSIRAMGDQDLGIQMGINNQGVGKSSSSLVDMMGSTHGTGVLDGMPTNGQVNVFSPSQQPAFHAGGDSDNSFGQSPHPAKSKVNIAELKHTLKRLEMDFLTVKKKDNQSKMQRCATVPPKGYMPTTSSPYSRQSMHSNGSSVGSLSHILGTRPSTDSSERSSPLQARRAASHLGHRSSPLEPLSTDNLANIEPPATSKVSQENYGGTTYFYTQGQKRQNLSVVVPPFNIFAGSPPSVEYMKQRVNAPSFFMPNELRQSLLKKQTLTMLTVDAEQDSSVPAEVDNYHSLFPIEPISDNVAQKSSTFSFVTSCYKAVKYKDRLSYCLRRIHGFRQVNQKCMVLVEMWKKIQHANIVTLREVFTSKAFGEHSLIFSHDYHAGAETLMARHFQNPNNNYASKLKWNSNGGKQHTGLLPESLIWTYIVQLTSALRCIHAAGLACRVMDPTKIIITEKSRLRINGVGIFDVLGYDSSHSNPRAHMPQYQQDDLIALGKVVLALACNSVAAIQRDNFPQSLDLVVMNYSADLKNFILYLLTPQQRPRSVNDIMPMIGARFYTQLDAAIMRADIVENELAKAVENDRLFKLISKLNIINERPGFDIDRDWSETGDRYLLKLFRDHVFHQVTETGAPWIDMAHIVQCLNKLDAGTPEKICLMSRDEQNVLVVSYADLKKAFNKCFEELNASQQR